MTAEGPDCDVPLLELVPPQQWQRLQDHFAEVLGIGLRTISHDKTLLINPSWPLSLDAEKIATLLKLGEELEELLPAGAMPRETITISRPVGLSFSVCPLRATPDRVLAYLVAGPVALGHREDADQFRRRVTELGLDYSAMWPLMLTIKVCSFGAMRAMLRLLEDVTNSLLELAYKARSLKGAAADAPKIDQAMMQYSRDRLTESLLDAAMAMTGADGGSVMLFDRQRQSLQITAARGLPEDVVAGTRVRQGQGIAGLAVAGSEILLLDEQTTDNRLKPLMTRPEIASSLVAPLVAETSQSPVGVLSLRTTSSARRFTTAHVDILRRLMNLAGMALGGLQLAGSAPRSLSPSSPPAGV